MVGNEDAGADFPGVGKSSELSGDAERVMDKRNTLRLEDSRDAVYNEGRTEPNFLCSLLGTEFETGTGMKDSGQGMETKQLLRDCGRRPGGGGHSRYSPGIPFEHPYPVTPKLVNL